MAAAAGSAQHSDIQSESPIDGRDKKPSAGITG